MLSRVRTEDVLFAAVTMHPYIEKYGYSVPLPIVSGAVVGEASQAMIEGAPVAFLLEREYCNVKFVGRRLVQAFPDRIDRVSMSAGKHFVARLKLPSEAVVLTNKSPSPEEPLCFFRHLDSDMYAGQPRAGMEHALVVFDALGVPKEFAFISY